VQETERRNHEAEKTAIAMEAEDADGSRELELADACEEGVWEEGQDADADENECGR
jgi:hypothetical protein